jgi:hypothetical protein
MNARRAGIHFLSAFEHWGGMENRPLRGNLVLRGGPKESSSEINNQAVEKFFLAEMISLPF